VFSARHVPIAKVNKTFVGGLETSDTGTFTMHALPGKYAMSVALPTSTTSTTTPDAGAPNKDAAPDISFMLPDLGGGGADCTALAACCPTLPATLKSQCETMAASGNAAACTGILTSLKLAGSCQ
jgi:hypothetical protein